jgi:hypothetical protein
VGRLENIVARNRRGGRPRERTVVTLGAGLILLLIISLMLFTNLGAPNVDPPPPPPPHEKGKARDIQLMPAPHKAPAATDRLPK